MERRPTSILTTLVVSVLALTLIAPRRLGLDPDRIAARQGLARAQHNLGLMYANGEGVPQDDVLAYAWWNLAAAQGHT